RGRRALRAARVGGADARFHDRHHTDAGGRRGIGRAVPVHRAERLTARGIRSDGPKYTCLAVTHLALARGVEGWSRHRRERMVWCVIMVSTDGSCLKNPGGAIGWAWVDHRGGAHSGGAPEGTNQIAE